MSTKEKFELEVKYPKVKIGMIVFNLVFVALTSSFATIEFVLHQYAFGALQVFWAVLFIYFTVLQVKLSVRTHGYAIGSSIIGAILETMEKETEKEFAKKSTAKPKVSEQGKKK